VKTELQKYALACLLAWGGSAMAQTNDAVSSVAAGETAPPIETAEPIPMTGTKSDAWNFAVSIYGLAPAMSGDVTVKGIPASLDVDFEKIWDNLDSCAMGTARISRGRWFLLADLLYMGLEGDSKRGIKVEFEQWLVSGAVGFELSKQIELLAGISYNKLHAELSGGPLGINPSDTQEWLDPFLGTDVSLPLTTKLSLHARADIGGFGVGADLTCQVFPYASWRFAQWGSLQAGYRWLYADYEDGSGTSQFGYDVLTQGPQLGITAHF
jgi:hypothetical protein